MGNKFMGKCIAGMASAAGSVKTSMSNTKQDGRIVDLERRIAALTSEIGSLTLLRLDAGDSGSDQTTRPIMERYEAILEAREAITAAEGEKKLKTLVCPHCGQKTSAGFSYCGRCGRAVSEASA